MGKQMQPIRDLETVHRITVELSRREDRRGRRMFLLWVVGVNMGLRVGDLVELKVGDLRGENFTYMPNKQEHKKGAHNITVPVPYEVKRVIDARCADMDDGDWLFQSQKKNATRKRDPSRVPKRKERPVNPGAISRQTARRDMIEIGKYCGLDMDVGCHTMRKTFGYQYYQQSHDIAFLQEWFYHNSPATTLIYIGVSLDNFTKAVSRSPFKGMLQGCDL